MNSECAHTSVCWAIPVCLSLFVPETAPLPGVLDLTLPHPLPHSQVLFGENREFLEEKAEALAAGSRGLVRPCAHLWVQWIQPPKSSCILINS